VCTDWAAWGSLRCWHTFSAKDRQRAATQDGATDYGVLLDEEKDSSLDGHYGGLEHAGAIGTARLYR